MFDHTLKLLAAVFLQTYHFTLSRHHNKLFYDLRVSDRCIFLSSSVHLNSTSANHFKNLSMRKYLIFYVVLQLTDLD